MSTGPHTKVNVSEFHNRRASDNFADSLRQRAIGHAFDLAVDRKQGLDYSTVDTICRAYEAHLKALGGEL
jgi:hypothetical protein